MQKFKGAELTEISIALAEYTMNPLGFVYFSFPWGEGELAGKTGPDKWQTKILKKIGEELKAGKGVKKEVKNVIRIAVASGHGIGKSALVAWIILWAISTYEDTKGVVTANTETQLKTKTWAELAKWHRLFIGKDLFSFTAAALFSVIPQHEKTWRLDMVPWSEHSPEAFAGLHNQGKRLFLIFDEASAIHDKIWEISEGALTDLDTQILWCAFGNPTRNVGRFKDCFAKYRHRWTTMQIDSRDVLITNKNQIQEWIDDYGEHSDFVKVRVKGQFPAASDRQLIPADVVEVARNVVLQKEQYEFAPVIIGVDMAWTGGDESVIYLRQGLFAKRLAVYARNNDDFAIGGYLASFEDEYQADAVFVDFGYGTGLVSAGQAMGRAWQLVNFAGQSLDKGCLNKRAQMWSDMAKWLRSGGCIPHDDQVLCDDLISPEYEIRLDGKMKLESKDSMKKRGLPSPNRADALALTFAFPVISKKSLKAYDSKIKSLLKKDNYNPFHD